MENIIQHLSHNDNMTPNQKHIIEKFLEDLDVLHPKSYLSTHYVPYHIKKSWMNH